MVCSHRRKSGRSTQSVRGLHGSRPARACASHAEVAMTAAGPLELSDPSSFRVLSGKSHLRPGADLFFPGYIPDLSGSPVSSFTGPCGLRRARSGHGSPRRGVLVAVPKGPDNHKGPGDSPVPCAWTEGKECGASFVTRSLASG